MIPLRIEFVVTQNPGMGRGGGVLPIMDLHGEAPTERGTYFRLEAYKRGGHKRIRISRAEV